MLTLLLEEVSQVRIEQNQPKLSGRIGLHQHSIESLFSNLAVIETKTQHRRRITGAILFLVSLAESRLSPGNEILVGHAQSGFCQKKLFCGIGKNRQLENPLFENNLQSKERKYARLKGEGIKACPSSIVSRSHSFVHHTPCTPQTLWVALAIRANWLFRARSNARQRIELACNSYRLVKVGTSGGHQQPYHVRQLAIRTTTIYAASIQLRLSAYGQDHFQIESHGLLSSTGGKLVNQYIAIAQL